MYDYRDYPDINFKLIELCKYQQSIIKRYEEYIEKYIHANIKTEDLADPLDPMGRVCCKRITIPQTTFILKGEPYILHEWKWLQHENPLISPDYFIGMAYQEQVEKKNAKTN